MKYGTRIITWVWLMVKRVLSSPLMVVLLIAMPVAGFIIYNLPAAAGDGKPGVVLYVEDEDEIAKGTVEQLIMSDGTITYYRADSQNTLYQDISSGKADFGYIIREDLSGRLDRKSYDEAIVMVAKEQSYITAISNEIVFKEMFRKYSARIAENYIVNLETKTVDKDVLKGALRDKIERYSMDAGISYFRFEMLDSESSNAGDTTSLDNVSVSYPVRGVLGVLVMVAALCGAVFYRSDRKKGVFAALSFESVPLLAILYVLVPTSLFAVSAEITLAFTGIGAFPYEMWRMFLYVLLLTAVAGILGLVVKNANVLAGAIPVLTVASLVFCPVFINLTGVVPVIRYICWLLPVYYYI
ncbi:MAG: hypothetical protein ACI4D0_01945 [Lachnospira sp.]